MKHKRRLWFQFLLRHSCLLRKINVTICIRLFIQNCLRDCMKLRKNDPVIQSLNLPIGFPITIQINQPYWSATIEMKSKMLYRWKASKIGEFIKFQQIFVLIFFLQTLSIFKRIAYGNTILVLRYIQIESKSFWLLNFNDDLIVPFECETRRIFQPWDLWR